MPDQLKRDPTRTTLLRMQFEADMVRRFKELSKDIYELVVDDDVFGLMSTNDGGLSLLQQMPKQAWRFRTNTQKVAEYRKWLKKKVDAGILSQQGGIAGRPWTAPYIESAYKKGLLRAYTDVRQQQLDATSSLFKGGQAEFLRQAFNSPIAQQKIEALYTRAFTDLQGVTAVMDTQMSRILASGLANGLAVRKIARELRDNVTDMTDKRARVITRTEIIRAHAEGQLDSYEQTNDEIKLEVMAEWLSAGDDRVCELCIDLDGTTMSVHEARGLLPRHPNCRCAWIPANVGEKEKGGKWPNKEAKEKAKEENKEVAKERAKVKRVKVAKKKDVAKRKLEKQDRQANKKAMREIAAKKKAEERINKVAARERAKIKKLKEALREKVRAKTIVSAPAPKVKVSKEPKVKVPKEPKITRIKGSKKNTIAEFKLSESPLPNKKYLGGGCNQSELVSNGIKGVFKARAGEMRELRPEMAAGTYAEREVAAYEIDKAMKFDFVPPTVIRKMAGHEGSLQLFAENAEIVDKIYRSHAAGAFTYSQAEATKVSVFDIIIGSCDRHKSNIMVQTIEKAGKVKYKMIGIDNGLAFPSLQKETFRMRIRSYAWNHCLEKGYMNIPSKTLGKVSALVSKELEVRAALKPLLKETEIDGVFARAKHLLETKRLPKDGDKLMNSDIVFYQMR